MEKIGLIKNKKYVIYERKSFVWINMMKVIKKEKRLEITAITQENLEELRISIAI